MVLAPALLRIAHGAEPVVLFDFEGGGHARYALSGRGKDLGCPTGLKAIFASKQQFPNCPTAPGVTFQLASISTPTPQLSSRTILQ
jgi:hypothetical protein